MAEIIMPKMSDAMTEGRVISWRKQVGDSVRQGEIIAEIETDKANVEIEAEASGILSVVLVSEGQTAPVGAVIAYINGAGVSSGMEETARSAQPVLSGPSQRPTEAPRTPAASGAQPLEERIKASPVARQLAAEHSVDLSRITGTGPGGRIVERDVQAYLAAAVEGRAVDRSPQPISPVGTPANALEEYEDLPLSRMRETIARAVVYNKQVAPHFYATSEIEMTRAFDLREQLRDVHGEEEGRVSVNDLIVKATALALRRHPDINSQFVEPRTLRRFRRVRLGIMVAVPDGLVLPVLHDADQMPLLALAREARRLTERAREGRLRQEDYTGATFSITNLGMYNVISFSAIISAPQAGILAVGRVEERPVARAGHVVIRPMMEVTLSADHRVTDGVGAAAFLGELKRILENPVLLLQ